MVGRLLLNGDDILAVASFHRLSAPDIFRDGTVILWPRKFKSGDEGIR